MKIIIKAALGVLLLPVFIAYRLADMVDGTRARVVRDRNLRDLRRRKKRLRKR